MHSLVFGGLCAFGSLTTFAQNAEVQIIHNSPDNLAGVVDIYLNGGATPAVDNLAFRQATAFLSLPAGVAAVGIAPANSTGPGDILATIPLTLVANEKYVVMASGILPNAIVPNNFSLYPGSVAANGANIAFNLEVKTAAQTTGTNAANTDLLVFHGSTDAPAVDVVAFGKGVPGATIVNDLAYGDFTAAYAGVPAQPYTLNVTPAAGTPVVDSFYVNLSGLGNGAAVVFASGFLNPGQNSSGPAKAFGLFAALPNGTVLPLTDIGEGRVQVVHNSADPAAALVDIYVDWVRDSIKLDNVAFRSATPFVTLPAGYPLTIKVAGSGSTSSSGALATFTPTLTNGGSFYVIASGNVGTGFAANPSGVSTAFDLAILGNAKETATAGNIDLRVFHGATDAPEVGIAANGNLAVPGFDFKEDAGPLTIPAAEYRIDVTAPNNATNVIAPFYLNASGLGGNGALALASGYLTPANNNGGPAFGLFAVLPSGGAFVPLTAVGNARAQVVHNSADPAAATVDIYVNILTDTIKLDNVAFRTATGFLSLPTGYPVKIGVALSTSTSIGDAIANFSLPLVTGESYYVIASGNVGTGFAANPSGVSTAFDLVALTGAKETATSGNIDLRVFHGATDAPEVGIAANGGLAVPAFDFKENAGPLTIPAAEYRIDVTAPNNAGNVIAPFYLDASGLGGNGALAVASGYLTPGNNNGGPAFGLFAVLPTGGAFVPLTAVGNARAQVIHNAADPVADTVDVYINTLADTIKLDNFAFRTATPFVNLPSGYPVDVVIALPTSTGIGNGVVTTIPVTAVAGERYHLVANGVLGLPGSSFAANPSGRPIAFQLLTVAGAREAGSAGNVDVKVLHGATDAPAVDVLANFNQASPLVSNAAYTDATGYATIPAADYTLSVTPTGAGNAGAVATFKAELAGLGGGAGIVLASGFLTPSANENGAAFGLLAVLPDGTAFLLDNTTSIDKVVNNGLIRLMPNPAANQVVLENVSDLTGDVAIRITDISGRVVYNLETVSTGNDRWNIGLSELNNGVYFVEMITEGTRSVQRLMIQR